jgi:tetratricopeptide (TPR) repeat protein
VRTKAVSLLLAVAILAASFSRASAKGDDAEQRARARYRAGMVHYGLGEYDAAIGEFKAAYEISQAPRLLYNIAQTYRLKNDYAEAATFYSNYLRFVPDAPNRAEVEQLIADMQKKQRDLEAQQQAEDERKQREENAAKVAAAAKLAEELRAARTERSLVTPPLLDQPQLVAPKRPVYKKWWFWTVVGGVVVASTAAALAATVGDRGVLPSGNLGTIDARHP